MYLKQLFENIVRNLTYNMGEKYILVDGQLLEDFMKLPEFSERCYLSCDGEVGFVPQSMYNIIMYNKD